MVSGGSQRVKSDNSRLIPWTAAVLLCFGAVAWLGFWSAASAWRDIWSIAPERLAARSYAAPRETLMTRLLQDMPSWRRGAPVPDILVSDMPDWDKPAKNPLMRKRRFLSAVLPSVLAVNEAISRDRALFERVAVRLAAHRPLNWAQTAWLRRLEAHYGVGFDQAAILRRRLDMVPPSLILAQAAMESGWGTSRFAKQGNALFGQRTWKGEGIAPAKAQNARFRVKSYDSPALSIYGYVHNLNTHPTYLRLRQIRESLRRADKPLDPLVLAQGLHRYSEIGTDYIGHLRNIILANRLTDFDPRPISTGSLPDAAEDPMPLASD